MIKDKRIQKLMEIAKKNNLGPGMMARLIGVSYSTYNRYQKGMTVPENQNTIEKIEKVIKKYST
jgi:DNA-binding XRE family transcriptional regulator